MERSSFLNLLGNHSKAIIGSVKYTMKDLPMSPIKIVPYHAVEISAFTVLWVFWGTENKHQQHRYHILQFNERHNYLRPT